MGPPFLCSAVMLGGSGGKAQPNSVASRLSTACERGPFFCKNAQTCRLGGLDPPLYTSMGGSGGKAPRIAKRPYQVDGVYLV